jgi:hypothetical protein
VFRELHGYSGKLQVAEVKAKGALTCLSTVAHLQLRTVVRCSGDPITGKEGDVNKVHHSLGQLFKEEGSKGLTEQRRIKRRGGGGTIHD